MLNAIIYCRVSTENQEREGSSLDTQEQACLEYCKQKGYAVTHVFREAYSGLTLERPELSKLRGFIEEANIDVLVIYSLDRLSRDPGDAAALSRSFDNLKISLEAVSEEIENTDTGKLIQYIKHYAFKVDADKRRECTMRGKKAWAKAGRIVNGTGHGPYGYVWNPSTKKRMIQPEEAAVVKRIFEYIAQGYSPIKVATWLNNEGVLTANKKSCWHPLTIKNLVRNTIYMGKTYYGKMIRVSKTRSVARPKEAWIEIPDASPPIVSPDLFEEANCALNRPGGRPGRAIIPYLLTGHIRCGYCDDFMFGQVLNKKYRYYKCSGSRATPTREAHCNSKYMRAEPIDNAVWDYVKEIISEPEVVLADIQKQQEYSQQQIAGNSIKQRRLDINKQLAALNRREARAIELFTIEQVNKDIVLDRLNEIRREQKAVEEERVQLDALDERLKSLSDTAVNLSDLCKRMSKRLDSCSFEEKRLALKALDIRVTVTQEKVDIKAALPIKATSKKQTSASLRGGNYLQ